MLPEQYVETLYSELEGGYFDIYLATTQNTLETTT